VHPVIVQELAAERIKAMLAEAGDARRARQARGPAVQDGRAPGAIGPARPAAGAGFPGNAIGHAPAMTGPARRGATGKLAIPAIRAAQYMPPWSPCRPGSGVCRPVRLGPAGTSVLDPPPGPSRQPAMPHANPDPAGDHMHASNYRGHRPAHEVRARAGAGRAVVHDAAGAGDRFCRAQRRGQVHHNAGDPRPGRRRCGQRMPARSASWPMAPRARRPHPGNDPGANGAGASRWLTRPRRCRPNVRNRSTNP
jgi:hypothetical protein